MKISDLNRASLFFTLDEQHNLVPAADAIEWAMWLEKESNRIVKQEIIGDVYISTIFLGVNTDPFRVGRMFETRVAVEADAMNIRRYLSWEEAAVSHRWVAVYVREALARGETLTPEIIGDALTAWPVCGVMAAVEMALIDKGMPAREAQLRALCDVSGFLHARLLGEARTVAIVPLMHSHAIISGISLLGREGIWYYKTYDDAKAALEAWDGTGEPAGWYRRGDDERAGHATITD